MKQLIFITLCVLVLKGTAQDTINVSNKNTTYITFPEDISYFDIGLPENFVADVGQGMENQGSLKESFDGKMLKIRCLKPTSDISSLMVKFGDKYEMLNLKYSQTPKKNFYKMYLDLNKPIGGNGSVYTPVVTAKKTTTLEAASSGSVTSKETLKLFADSVLKMKNELKEYGFIDDYLQAAVTVIRNDNNNTYLKIAIQNKSSIPYKFDFISFQYVQKMDKGIMKSKKKAPQDVFPTYTPAAGDIPANSGKYVTYAIPSFGLANNGYLLVLFREKNGDRVLKIYIPSHIIQSSGYLK